MKKGKICFQCWWIKEKMCVRNKPSEFQGKTLNMSKQQFWKDIRINEDIFRQSSDWKFRWRSTFNCEWSVCVCVHFCSLLTSLYGFSWDDSCNYSPLNYAPYSKYCSQSLSHQPFPLGPLSSWIRITEWSTKWFYTKLHICNCSNAWQSPKTALFAKGIPNSKNQWKSFQGLYNWNTLG